MSSMVMWVVTPCNSERATCFCCFLSRLTHLPLRWKRDVPPKRRGVSEPHGFTAQKTILFIVNILFSLIAFCSVNLIYNQVEWPGIKYTSFLVVFRLMSMGHELHPDSWSLMRRLQRPYGPLYCAPSVHSCHVKLCPRFDELLSKTSRWIRLWNLCLNPLVPKGNIASA
jgi:hypothetical protein